MADVSSTLNAWSTTESSNAPSGTTTIGTGLDENLRMIQAVVRQTQDTSTIASAGTTDLSTVNNKYVTVTGTTTITALGTLTAGMTKWLIFSGALTLTHNGTSLILPGAANITTVAGDTALMESLGGGNWRCLAYEPTTWTGTGGQVHATSPTLVTPILGTPTSGTLTNCTIPASALTGTTLAANVVTSSLTTVGALTGGSIGTGFSSINIGSQALTAGTTSVGQFTASTGATDKIATFTSSNVNPYLLLQNSANGNTSNDFELLYQIKNASNSSITAAYTSLGLSTITAGSENATYKHFQAVAGSLTNVFQITGSTVTMGGYGAGTATFSSAGVISSVSDERLKVKDGVIKDPISMLMALEPGYFYGKSEANMGEDRQLGFYAQNVRKAIGPEAAPDPVEGRPWGYFDRSVLAVVVNSAQNHESRLAKLEKLANSAPA